MSNRVEVLALGLLILISSALTLLLIKKQQKRISFIHPGWILVVVSFFYAIMVPIAYVVYGNEIYKIYSDVFRWFDKDALIKVMYMYFSLSIGFLYSQGMISIINNIGRRNNTVNNNRYMSIQAIDKKLLCTIIAFFPVIGVYLIYGRFAAAGGFVATMTFNRRDLAGIIAETGIFARYEYFFQLFFIIIFAIFSNNRFKKKSKIFVFFMLTIYVVFLLINGIRLLIIVLALGIVFTLYSNTLKIYTKDKTKLILSEFWNRYRKRIIILGIVTFLFFGWYTFQRASIRSSLIGQEINLTGVSLGKLMFPQEFSTGYVPGILMISNDWHDLGTSYWKKFVPKSVLSLIGIEQGNTVANDLVWSLYGVGRAAVYTITLPVDIYSATSSYIMIIVIGSTLYFIFWALISILSRRGFWGNCFSSLIFLNLYYVIRVEAANWFPRIWQSGLILFLTMILYLLLSKDRIIRKSSC